MRQHSRISRIPRNLLKKYLESLGCKNVRIKKYHKLGQGWHGISYKIPFGCDHEEKKLILRTEIPYRFSHDYLSDRAKLFILQHKLSNSLPQHVRSFDVVGLEKDRIVSLSRCKEFYQIVEQARGSAYSRDLERIARGGALEAQDREKALLLSDYLVKLHKKKYSGDKKSAESIYARHTRDCIGHGEMLIGVLDTYPEKLDWISKNELIQIIKMAVEFREKIKKNCYRLSRIHGDFHPGNVYFSGKKFQVVDASREEFGDPADDLSAMSINYLWCALQQRGNFSGPFKELFELFWKNYIRKTGDHEINRIVPLFFAFRGVVVAHPVFYPDQDDSVRIQIFNFVKNILVEEEFEFGKINRYIQ